MSAAHRLLALSDLRKQLSEREVAKARGVVSSREAERQAAVDQQSAFYAELPQRHARLRKEILDNARYSHDLTRFRQAQNKIIQEESAHHTAVHVAGLAVEEAKIALQEQQKAHFAVCATREKRAEIAKRVDAERDRDTQRKAEEITEELVSVRIAANQLGAGHDDQTST